LKRTITLLLAAFAALAAHAQMKVGVVSSATGPTSAVGIPQKNSAALLPRKIGNIDVEYFVYDDASDPTQTVTLFKKLLSENKVDAIIGPSGSPNAMGTLQFVAESGTPLLAPVGTPAVVLPMDDKKRWVFKTTQNDSLIADALVAHMAKHGIKTVGFIGLADAYGESWLQTFTPMAEKAGIKTVAVERFARSDQSVIGQVA
jgi:branched-chain amino acid transport system substrate-binding protein